MSLNTRIELVSVMRDELEDKIIAYFESKFGENFSEEQLLIMTNVVQQITIDLATQAGISQARLGSWVTNAALSDPVMWGHKMIADA